MQSMNWSSALNLEGGGDVASGPIDMVVASSKPESRLL